jgi:hypothetical protein
MMHKWCCSFLMGLSLSLVGCERTPQQNLDPHISQEDLSSSSTQPLKTFPQTAQDQADIARLTDFDQRFYAVSEEMEKELEQMEKAGTLTAEFSHQRRTDNVKSALVMLSDLELETEQGRYIQGLFVSYWEKQAALLNANTKESAPTPRQTLQDLSIYLHGQEQLDHWQAQYTHQQEDQDQPDPPSNDAKPNTSSIKD